MMSSARLFIASLVLFCVASIASAATDYSSPKAAFRTYTQALANEDAKALKESVISSDKIDTLLDGQISYTGIERKFRLAILKAYPAAARDLPDPAQQTLDAIEKAEVKIDNDSATLVTKDNLEPVRLQKIDDKWKVNLRAMYADDAVEDVILFRKALADVMEDMTPDVEAAKYKNFDDVKNTLEMRVKMRIALPQSEDATTKPAK
jgi:hypothetical protein